MFDCPARMKTLTLWEYAGVRKPRKVRAREAEKYVFILIVSGGI
jgi:hypothetical protein